jgi:transposase
VRFPQAQPSAAQIARPWPRTTRTQIGELVDDTGTHLTDRLGIGPLIAGRILAEVETVDRFPSKDHFASYNGTAPIDASSGEQAITTCRRCSTDRGGLTLDVGTTQGEDQGTRARH